MSLSFILPSPQLSEEHIKSLNGKILQDLEDKYNLSSVVNYSGKQWGRCLAQQLKYCLLQPYPRPRTMTQQLNTCPTSTTTPYGHQFVHQLLHFPSGFLLAAWVSSGTWPKALRHYTCVGDTAEAPGSRLLLSSAPVVVATWRVNQRTEDLSPVLPFSLYFYFSNNKKYKNK